MAEPQEKTEIIGYVVSRKGFERTFLIGGTAWNGQKDVPMDDKLTYKLACMLYCSWEGTKHEATANIKEIEAAPKLTPREDPSPKSFTGGIFSSTWCSEYTKFAVDPTVKLKKLLVGKARKFAGVHALHGVSPHVESIFKDQKDWTDALLFTVPLNGISVADVIFDHSVIRVIGGSTFTRCSFRGANFDGGVLHASKFIECNFSNALSRHAEISRCSFDSCTGVSEFLLHANSYENETAQD